MNLTTLWYETWDEPWTSTYNQIWWNQAGGRMDRVRNKVANKEVDNIEDEVVFQLREEIN